MLVFLISVIGSLVAAAIYGFFIFGREDRIREYLRKTKTGLLRRLYVMTLVSAIRGGSVVASARHLTYLTVWALFAFYLFGSSLILEQQQRISDARRNLQGSERSLEETDDARPLRTEEQYKRELGELRKALGEANEELRQTIQRAEVSLFYYRIFNSIVAVIAIATLYVWLPFVTMRSRFSYEVARFSLRIQGLATKAELARLTAAEVLVYDVETLKLYVMIMKEVAARHGLAVLTQTFELWEPEGTKVAPDA